MSRLYDITWIRNSDPDDVMVCSSLTPKIFLSRLMRAIKISGPITIKNIEPRKINAKK